MESVERKVERCVIVGAAPYRDVPFLASHLRDGDCIIAADGGARFAREAGLTPRLWIGDFDSSPPPAVSEGTVRVLPSRKDDTDVMAAVRWALDRGYRDFLFLCCSGGRLDHTLGNLSVLRYLLSHGATGVLQDEDQQVRLLSPGRYTFPPVKGAVFSLLPFGGDVLHVTLTDVGYPLRDGAFLCDFPLGISNTFTDLPAGIEFTDGYLLFILTYHPESAQPPADG